MQRKPNQFQLPHDLPTYLGLATISDWHDYHNLHLCLSGYREDTGVKFALGGPPHLSALHATFTEALMLQLQLKAVPYCENRLRKCLILGMKGPLVCRPVCWRCSQVFLLLQSRRTRTPSAVLCHSELIACLIGLPSRFSPF